MPTTLFQNIFITQERSSPYPCPSSPGSWQPLNLHSLPMDLAFLDISGKCNHTGWPFVAGSFHVCLQWCRNVHTILFCLCVMSHCWGRPGFLYLPMRYGQFSPLGSLSDAAVNVHTQARGHGVFHSPRYPHLGD